MIAYDSVCYRGIRDAEDSLKLQKDIQWNLNTSNNDGSFIMAKSNSFLAPIRNSLNSSSKEIFWEIFSLVYSVMVCFVYLLESLNRGDSDEYKQHTINARDRKYFPRL